MLAHCFINFMLAGENAADVSNLIGAGNPNAAAMPHIAPQLVALPALFPTVDQLARLEMLHDFDARTRRALARWWVEVKVR